MDYSGTTSHQWIQLTQNPPIFLLAERERRGPLVWIRSSTSSRSMHLSGQPSDVCRDCSSATLFGWDLYLLKERCNLLLQLGLYGELCLSHSKRQLGTNLLFSDTNTCHFVGDVSHWDTLDILDTSGRSNMALCFAKRPIHCSKINLSAGIFSEQPKSDLSCGSLCSGSGSYTWMVGPCPQLT